MGRGVGTLATNETTMTAEKCLALLREITEDLNKLSQEQLHCLAVIIHGLRR